LCRNLVLPDVPFRQLHRDLELDRHEVLAAHLSCAAGRQHGFHGREFLLAAERLARGREHGGGGIGPRCLSGQSGHENA
jgi:hypothetical protein